MNLRLSSCARVSLKSIASSHDTEACKIHSSFIDYLVELLFHPYFHALLRETQKGLGASSSKKSTVAVQKIIWEKK